MQLAIILFFIVSGALIMIPPAARIGIFLGQQTPLVLNHPQFIQAVTRENDREIILIIGICLCGACINICGAYVLAALR